MSLQAFTVLALLWASTIGGQRCGSLHPECVPYARVLRSLSKTKEQWEAAGGITAEARDRTRETALTTEGAFVTISQGVAYVDVINKGFQTRLFGNLLLLYKAMARLGRENFPDEDFGVNPGDFPHGDAFFSYCREIQEQGPPKWLWPDFGFYGWPEISAPPWPLLLQRVAAEALPFERRINKFFWRGTLNYLTTIRGALVLKYRKRTDIADVNFITGFDEVHKAVAADHQFNVSSMITKLEDFCRYKYIIYTEGNSYSGRLKAHLICGSVIISHKRRWESFESALMEEGVNVLTSDNDWNTLEDIYRRLETEQGLAERIAAENAEMRRLLSEDGISCYILESLKCFKDVARFDVSPPSNRTTLEHYLLSKLNSTHVHRT